jgi:hypothetical protein
MYWEKNSIEIHETSEVSKTQGGDKNILKIEVPSLGMLVVRSQQLNESDFNKICKDINLPQQKNEALKKIRLKLSICIQSMFEISNVCEKLKDIEAPTILYKEEINQVKVLNERLNEISEKLVSLGMDRLHFKISLCKKHNHIKHPEMIIFNHSNEGKPFMFVS